MVEREKPASLTQHRMKKLLTERSHYQGKIDGINQELARIAAGIETLAEKQMRFRSVISSPLPENSSLSRFLPNTDPHFTHEE